MITADSTGFTADSTSITADASFGRLPAQWCPTFDQTTAQILALLPRGRAWQSNEGLPSLTWPGQPQESVLYKYWRAFAAAVSYLHDEICRFRREFWCATHDETHDLWMVEYGLPDHCDPFPNLCDKVAALGETRCDYYQRVAARMGWSIECVFQDPCGAFVGQFEAGCGEAGGGSPPATMMVLVYLDEQSPAYEGSHEPLTGVLQAGDSLSCPVDITPLVCVLERIVHADVQISYQF